MNINRNEEVHYCTHCGAVNKKSAVECTECEKKIFTKYRPFYDFLKKHTKDEASGAAVDSVFSLIQKFLLSHVYGIALSVSIVATTVAAVQASQPHIKKVDAPISVSVSSPQDNTETGQKEQNFELTEDDLYAFEHLACNYDAFVDTRRSSDGYWDQSVKYYGDASEMYAENNIDGFNYVGVHDMISNPIDFHMVDEDPAINQDAYDMSYVYESRRTLPDTAVTGASCTTEIAKKLHADGYKVAECNYMLNSGIGEHDFENHTGGTDLRRLVYKFVFVENNGDWYIVEDRLLENYRV